MITEKDDDTDNDPAPVDEEHVVDITPADDDEPEEAAVPSREEKKRRRQGLREENEKLSLEKRALEDRLTRSEQVQQDLQRQMAETRTQISRANDRGDDPLERELGDVRRRLQSLASTASGLGERATKEQLDDLQSQATELRDRELELVAERVQRRNAPRQDPAESVRQSMAAMFPEAYANPKARGWAKGHFQQLIADRGEPQNQAEAMKMLRESFVEAEKKYGINRPAPSETDRRKFDGIPRGGTGGKGKAITEVDMSDPVHQRMANAAFPHIKDKKARWTKWASGAGKRLAEKKVAGKR